MPARLYVVAAGLIRRAPWATIASPGLRQDGAVAVAIALRRCAAAASTSHPWSSALRRRWSPPDARASGQRSHALSRSAVAPSARLAEPAEPASARMLPADPAVSVRSGARRRGRGKTSRQRC
eukprot:952460-Prymnesium_polylepis.1